MELAWNPEFLREGFAVADTQRPDRIVIGTDSDSADELLRQVYSNQISAGVPYLRTDLATSELVKVAANSFLATKISFINAMAEVCDRAGADVTALAHAIGYDDRIGSKFLRAGLGFGGGCLPKDIQAFMARAGELGVDDALSFLKEIDDINLRQRSRTANAAATMLGGTVNEKVIAALGAAFKPDSDDVRDSPALDVAANLHLQGANVRVYDPKAMVNAAAQFPTLDFVDSAVEVCAGADIVLLLTEWNEFVTLTRTSLRAGLPGDESWMPATCWIRRSGAKLGGSTRESVARKQPTQPAVWLEVLHRGDGSRVYSSACVVGGNHFRRRAVHLQLALFEPDGVGAQFLNRRQRV